MASLRFDASRIDMLGSTLRIAAAEIQEHLLLLERETSALRASWTGEAQHAYDAAHREWSQSLAAIDDLFDAGAELAKRGARQ